MAIPPTNNEENPMPAARIEPMSPTSDVPRDSVDAKRAPQIGSGFQNDISSASIGTHFISGKETLQKITIPIPSTAERALPFSSQTSFQQIKANLRSRRGRTV